MASMLIYDFIVNPSGVPFRAPKGREERSDDVSFFRSFFFGTLKEKSL